MNLSDIFEGVWWYCHDWHGGQTTREYSLLSRIKFKPALRQRGPSSHEAREVYANLVRKYHPDTCNYNPCACVSLTNSCGCEADTEVGVPGIVQCAYCEEAWCDPWNGEDRRCGSHELDEVEG